MDPKSIQGKWVAEAFDLLRLFRFVERSVAGLLFVLVLWSLLLGLVLKPMAAGADGSLQNPVSWVYGPDTVRPVEAWVAGSSAILLWWIIRSGAYHLTLGPALRLGRVAVFVLIAALLVVALPLALAWVAVAWPIEARRIRRFREGLGPEKVADIEKTLPLSDNRDWWADQAGFNTGWPVQWVRRHIALLTAPHGRVGLAPFVSVSYLEEVQASKAYPQALAWAADRLGERLGSIDRLRYVRLVLLSGLFAVRSNKAARFARWLFRCDVVIWGSYQSPEDGTLWLNLSSRPSRRDDREREEKDDRGKSYDEQLFNLGFHPRLPSVTVAQSEPWEVYALLLLSVYMLLRLRQDKPRPAPFGVDPLKYAMAERDRVWRLFLDDVFSRWSEPPREHFFSPVSLASARLVGDWVGSKMCMMSRDVPDDDLRRYLDPAARCARLLPDDPRCWYRLGALECAVGSIETGFAHFARAGEAESKYGQSVALYSRVSIDLDVGINKDHLTDLVFARIAAHDAVRCLCASAVVTELLAADHDLIPWAD